MDLFLWVLLIPFIYLFIKYRFYAVVLFFIGLFAAVIYYQGSPFL